MSSENPGLYTSGSVQDPKGKDTVFLCSDCGKVFTVVVSLTQGAEVKCPRCGETTELYLGKGSLFGEKEPVDNF